MVDPAGFYGRGCQEKTLFPSLKGEVILSDIPFYRTRLVRPACGKRAGVTARKSAHHEMGVGVGRGLGGGLQSQGGRWHFGPAIKRGQRHCQAHAATSSLSASSQMPTRSSESSRCRRTISMVNPARIASPSLSGAFCTFLPFKKVPWRLFRS